MRWGTSISESFPIENGVRQGGILSPKLFNFYIDALSTRLNSIPAGCKIGNLMVNHLAYADDLVLLCPPPSRVSSVWYMSVRFMV